ncbi:MAG: hypothetical protein M3Y18_06475 [Candidatus Eremiobacteraeota bacterium]|nr:hypothetical protein [Candidatus Eremiobacteraeota bacterium]
MLVATLVGAYVERDRIAGRMHPSKRIDAPPAQGGLIAAAQHFGAVYGDAPWALSALPECLDQTRIVTGRPAYVLRHKSERFVRVPPSTLHVADCTLIVRADSILVQRGKDRLRIPPPAQLFRFGGELALLRANAKHAELRLYAASKLP